MQLEEFKPYKHLYPKLRLSWSLYQKFVQKDTIGIFNYLLDIEAPKSLAASEGSRIHKKIELEGIKNVLGLEKLIDVGKEYRIESKIVVERNDYLIVCQPDLYCEDFVIDWKTGGTSGYEGQLQLYMWAIGERCLNAYIVPIKEIDGKIVVQRGIKQYQRNEKTVNDWGYRFDDMANDINLWISKGKLQKYILQRI